MPPKKASTAAAASKKAAPSHASYRDMIKDAIVSLKDRNGSSRQSIKKYVQNNNKIAVVSQAAFDSQFNKAIKAGVEKGEFSQPKGPSGPVKLAKKEAAAKPVAKKPVAAAKPAAPKKTTAKKPATAAKPAKKATTTKKAAAKPKANTAKPRKTSTAAPAIVDAPKVETKTKSGRVTKTTAKPAPKKAAPKKKATPKKAEA
jgi:histone H1/5